MERGKYGLIVLLVAIPSRRGGGRGPSCCARIISRPDEARPFIVVGRLVAGTTTQEGDKLLIAAFLFTAL